MDILAVVQEHAIESALTVLVVGILQGAVLARGVRNRFPKLKRHTRTVSAIFLILLTISAAINVVKFANPEKYEFVMPDNFTGETLAWAVFSLIGLDGSLASSVIIMLSVTVFLIFRTARMHTVTRYFIFTLSVVTFGVFYRFYSKRSATFAVCSIPSWNCLGCVCSIKKRYQDRRFIRMMVEPDPSFRLLSFHMRIRTCVSFFQ